MTEYKKKYELDGLIEQEGMPTFWFSFSAADNHWLDLHKIITGSDYDPFTDNALHNAKIRRKLVRENPHIVDAYFYERSQTLLDVFFEASNIEVTYKWIRIEYQLRGTPHVHGCIRIK